MDKKLSRQHLVELKEILLKEVIKTKARIEELKKKDPFADPDHASDNAAIDTDVREQVGHDTIEAQVKDLERRLLDIETAIRRIGKGAYGKCEKCGAVIPFARLRLVPEARFCVECENKLRK